jgi:acyl-[acyl-carrier-protein] desaturase
MDTTHTNPITIEAQNDIIRTYLEPELDGLLAAHDKARIDWFPSDLLPASQHMSTAEMEYVAELKQQSAQLPDAARIALVLNLITEEGLPSYHRLLHQAFGDKSSWGIWRNQWTAEEDRHGNLLRDYMRDCRIVDMKYVEQLQFRFLSNGWMPEWAGDPYSTIAYTSFQERATQVSHRNLGKYVQKITPGLSRILGHIAGDESRHYNFYASLLKKLLQVDVEKILQAIHATLKTFKMPGHDIPGFNDMSITQHAVDIFGPKEFSEVINDVLKFIKLEELTNLSDYCEELRQKILAYPPRLLQFHNKLINKVKEKVNDFSFDAIYHRKIILA